MAVNFINRKLSEGIPLEAGKLGPVLKPKAGAADNYKGSAESQKNYVPECKFPE
jgi:hypothetical protein